MGEQLLIAEQLLGDKVNFRDPALLERPHWGENTYKNRMFLPPPDILPSLVRAPECGFSFSFTSQPILTFILVCFLRIFS